MKLSKDSRRVVAVPLPATGRELPTAVAKPPEPVAKA
jgi:hypothetical protein